ncbi:MAG: hypothetical protein CMC76_08625 [Flavobacteriaceae bacterium]|nr:hypothetical protein [Flavobacteriaceae bacterium]
MLGFCISNSTQAQQKAKQKDSTKVDSVKVDKNNFADLQSKTITGIFGENLDGKSTGKKLGFLELLEKMDLSPEQKLEYKNMYYAQAKELTQKQKDSLGKAIEKKILEVKATTKE